jgi:AcrR family transcriptional regulator
MVRGVAEGEDAVLSAAARCFEQFGIAKTSMRDVAAVAEISRPALYRLFPNRQTLVDAVLRQRIEELVDKVLPVALSSGSFAEAFLEGAMAGIDYVRSTPDLRRLLRETSIDDASRTILRPGTAMGQLTASLWKPILDWGRGRGEVRADLVDEDFIEWTGTIILVYSAREDIPHERLRMLLRSYLLPVVVGTSGDSPRG